MRFTLVLSLVLLASAASAQEVESNIRQGNIFYRQDKYQEAATEYGKAGADPRALFNLYLANYRAGDHENGIAGFRQMTNSPGQPDSIRSRSYYNLGVIHTNGKQLEESIEAYKRALILDPSDQQARENLQKALLELKKKSPPPPRPKQNPPQKKPPPRISKSQAEQKLQQLRQKEQQTLEKLQQKKPVGIKEKDW